MAAPSSDNSEPQPPRVRGPPPGATAPPEHITNGKPQIYEIFNAGRSEERRFPSGAIDSATGTNTTTFPPTSTGGQQQQQTQQRPTFTEGVQSIKSDDFLKIHRMPCARSGFMTGIAAGAVVGMGRFVFGGKFCAAVFIVPH